MSDITEARPLFLRPLHFLILLAAASMCLAASVGCGASAPQPAPEAEDAVDAHFVLLPGCEPFHRVVLHLDGVSGLLYSAVPSLASTGASPAELDGSWIAASPGPLRRRARILDRWANDALALSTSDSLTPWGTSPSDVAGRIQSIALATRALADAAEAAQMPLVEAAHGDLRRAVGALQPLAERATAACFSERGRPLAGRRPAPQEIQATVRAHFSQIRVCYMDGLRRNPVLAGTVTVKFGIHRHGTAPWAVVDGTDLPDEGVADCIAEELSRMVFPPPTHGIVVVSYPIRLSVDGAAVEQDDSSSEN